MFGDNFLPAYTEGDNSNVVATDSMKNFVHRKGAEYAGSTLEGFAHFLAGEFLAIYQHVGALAISAREMPFRAASVPVEGGFGESEVLFARGREDAGFASLRVERAGAAIRIVDHRSGRTDLQLIKVTGSSFARFVRDDYTTLPDVIDRPLFIHLDVYWTYASPDDAVDADLAGYVPSEQVRDVVQAVFHRFNSRSIQHLIHEIGLVLLDHYPRLATIHFAAQNRLWDTAVVSESDPRIKAYTDPRPPYGAITLTMSRD